VAAIARGATTPGAVIGTADPAPGESWRCGKLASSEIFWVGATR
jgi:hypothetical protein